MRNRIFFVFALAIVAGGGLAYATFNAINTQPVKTVSAPTQPIVVAAADLSLGTELKKDDLTIVNFPKGTAPEGTFASPSDVIGRGLIVPLVKNEPLLPGKLASKEAGSGLPPIIPQGMRAVSVRVNEVVGVAGYVLPGTHVDVVATANPSNQTSDVSRSWMNTAVRPSVPIVRDRGRSVAATASSRQLGGGFRSLRG